MAKIHVTHEQLNDLDRRLVEILPGPLRHTALESLRFRATLVGETDRGCALMAAAFLDDRLAELIKAKLLDDASEVEKLLAPTAPLGSFSSRIGIAYLMGLLPRKARRDLHLVRKIRNDFAHTASPLAFEDEQVAARCRELAFAPTPSVPPRASFTGATMLLLAVIQASNANTNRVEPRPEVDPVAISQDRDGLRAVISQLKLPEELQAIYDEMARVSTDENVKPA